VCRQSPGHSSCGSSYTGSICYLYTRSDWFGGGVRRTPGLLCPFPVTASPSSSSSLIVYRLGRLVDKISPAFELRNSGVPAVARSSQLPWVYLHTPKRSQVQSRRCLAARWGQTGHPKYRLVLKQAMRAAPVFFGVRWHGTCKQHFRSKIFEPRNWWSCLAPAMIRTNGVSYRIVLICRNDNLRWLSQPAPAVMASRLLHLLSLPAQQRLSSGPQHGEPTP
jgi:hypothetical protein